MNIYIDFDDTITMSIENIVRIVNKRYDKNVKSIDIAKWDFSDVYPDISHKSIIDIFGEEEFFNTLHLKPNVLPVLRKYSKYNDIIIVSKVSLQAMKRKNEWIKTHLSSIGIPLQFRGVSLRRSKGDIDMSDGIMIDDNTSFLRETNAKYKIFYKNNRKFDELQNLDDVDYVVSDWTELDTVLNKIISKEKGYTNGKI